MNHLYLGTLRTFGAVTALAGDRPSAALGLVLGDSLPSRAGRTLLEAMRADRYEALYVLCLERQVREIDYLYVLVQLRDR